MSPDMVEDVEDNIGDFEKAVAKAEQLSKVAREAAGVSTKAAMEAAHRAERIGREAKTFAEQAAKAAVFIQPNRGGPRARYPEVATWI